MSRFLIKHPALAGYIFGLIIIYWLALGNLSPLVLSRFNIVISIEVVLFAIMSGMFFSNLFLYKCIPSKNLNVYELFLNSVLPVLVFYTVKVADYNIYIVGITLGLIIITSIVFCYLQKRWGVKKIRIIYFLRHIIAFNIVLLIIPSYLYYRYEKPKQEYFGGVSVYEQEYPVHSERIESELRNCDWDSLSISDKGKYLLEFVEYESKILGINPPKITVENLDTEVIKGSYSHSRKTITINSYYLLSDDLEECLITVAHELYHAFQQSVVDIIENINSEEFMYNSYFNRARDWMDARDSYAEDKKTAKGYESNALEIDAREYAKDIVEKYNLDKE